MIVTRDRMLEIQGLQINTVIKQGIQTLHLFANMTPTQGKKEMNTIQEETRGEARKTTKEKV